MKTWKLIKCKAPYNSRAFLFNRYRKKKMGSFLLNETWGLPTRGGGGVTSKNVGVSKPIWITDCGNGTHSGVFKWFPERRWNNALPGIRFCVYLHLLVIVIRIPRDLLGWTTGLKTRSVFLHLLVFRGLTCSAVNLLFVCFWCSLHLHLCRG